jgi:MoaA/NifB/PqqE/SkfB family radical SAM enzyme
MQISIDNVMPDAVSKKSLKVLDAKLKMLAEHALFHVNINSVVGGGIANPEDAYTISKRALELGFSSTIGIIHDGSGQLKPLGAAEREVWDRVRKLTRRSYSRFNGFQEAIANGEPNDWRCRAGSRYLYICENGLVHYCSQQRGYPGVPLAQYGTEDVRREFLTEKGCAPNCTISCVHQVSYIDHWRAPQHPEAQAPTGGHGGGVESELVQIR